MLRYDTILWDLDGTLLDFKMSERYALGVCLKSWGVDMTEEMLSLYSGINEAYWERLERGEVEKRELLSGRFREFFRQAGFVGIDPEAMRRAYERELGTKTYYRDDSYEIVAKLKEMGLKQYIVTNGFRRERALLVGDSLTSDMRGANNAGVDACFYNPQKKVLPDGKGDAEPLRIAYEIENLREVFGIISM